MSNVLKTKKNVSVPEFLQRFCSGPNGRRKLEMVVIVEAALVIYQIFLVTFTVFILNQLQKTDNY